MTLSGSKYALATVELRGRKRIVEITSTANEQGELLCTTGGKNYLIHGSRLQPITQKAADYLRPFGVSTATRPFQKED